MHVSVVHLLLWIALSRWNELDQVRELDFVLDEMLNAAHHNHWDHNVDRCTLL